MGRQAPEAVPEGFPQHHRMVEMELLEVAAEVARATLKEDTAVPVGWTPLL